MKRLTLGEVLSLHNAHARAAGEIRDRRVATEGAQKIASEEKDAGLRDAWAALVRLAKKPFVATPAEKAQKMVHDKLMMEAQALVHPIPSQQGIDATDWLKAMEKARTERPAQIIERVTEKQIPIRRQTLQPTTETKLVEVPQRPTPGQPQTGELQVKAQETVERMVPITEEKLAPVKEITRTVELGPTRAEGYEQARRIFETVTRPAKSKMPMGLALAGLGGIAAFPVLDEMHTKHIHQSNLEGIVKDPMIPTSHKMKAQDAFKILSTYAPSIAKDPVFSRDFTRSLIRYDSVDHKVVSDLIQAEKHFQESKGKKAEFLRSIGGTVFGTMLGIGG